MNTSGKSNCAHIPISTLVFADSLKKNVVRNTHPTPISSEVRKDLKLVIEGEEAKKKKFITSSIASALSI